MKGPKAILSSSIATALDEFFEIDKEAIHSNLLGDASISLDDVKLRPRSAALPNGSSNIEGKVSNASFSWKWGLTGDWVQDATLTISGLQVEMTLSEEKVEPDTTNIEETIEQEAKKHASNPEEIKKQGGIRGYIQNQVQKIMDSVKVRIENYEFTIVLPDKTRLITQGQLLELVSLGRILPTEGSQSKLEQEMNLENFVMQITDENQKNILKLVDPFSYSANLERTGGQRFDRINENLKVQGNGPELKFHLGARQLQILSALAVLVMAPPEEAKNQSKKEDSKDDDDKIGTGDTASTLEFCLGLLELNMDGTKLQLPKSKFQYCFDGTKCFLESDSFEMTGEKDMRAKVSHGLQANLLTPTTVTIGQIDELIVPHVVKLTKPVSVTQVVKEGQTYSVVFSDPVALEMLRAEKGGGNTEEEKKEEEKEEDVPVQNIVPFPLSVSLPELVITKEEDDNRLNLDKISVYANPTEDGTEFAVELKKVENYLLCVEEAMVAGKTGRPTELKNFRFCSKAAQVTAGHTPSEWAAAFEQGTKEEKEERFEKVMEENKTNEEAAAAAATNDGKKSAPFELPDCYVDPLRLTISWKGKAGMSVKDTKVTVKAFKGKPDTNSYDLIKYYVQSCLAHASDFIPNAELFGLNVVDSTMGTMGNLLGMATLGPLGGIAALGAVDTVKSQISKGKKARNADEGAQTNPLDLVRGVAYSVAETGQSFGSNPLAWAQNTVGSTGNYIGENKARLGGAGVGAGGMIVGGLLAGPIGAIAAGVASQGIAGKVIDDMGGKDKKQSQKVAAK